MGKEEGSEGMLYPATIFDILWIFCQGNRIFSEEK